MQGTNPTGSSVSLTLSRLNDAFHLLQGTIVDMLEDVNTGIDWVLQKISNYGGDPEQVYLVGQSCGGQLCTLTTLIQVLLCRFMVQTPYHACIMVVGHVSACPSASLY